MALSDTSCKQIETNLEEISELLGKSGSHGMKNSLNTFNYVANNLKFWADETVIGKELQKQMLELADRLNVLIENTDKFQKLLTAFVAKQKVLNSFRR